MSYFHAFWTCNVTSDHAGACPFRVCVGSRDLTWAAAGRLQNSIDRLPACRRRPRDNRRDRSNIAVARFLHMPRRSASLPRPMSGRAM